MINFSKLLERLSIDSSPRQKGTLFEKLMVAVLPQHPEFDFKEVWLWRDWPQREELTSLDGRDTGIDLVARRSTGDYCAIQCKFYSQESTIQKANIDSFFTASGIDAFKSRLIITTTDKWSEHAERSLDHQSIPVTRLLFSDLENWDIDWDLNSPDKTKINKHRKTPNNQQEKGIKQVLDGLKTEDRGKMIMACGTGKTLTSLHIAERYVPAGGHVLFMVPSIALMSQSIREWAWERKRDHRYVAVCSDAQVGREEEDISATALTIPATTNAKSISKALRTPLPSDENHLNVTFCTYHSLELIQQAQQQGTPEYDLVICDEAHRTTGVKTATKQTHFTLIHESDKIKAKKRLYMTATPRIYGEKSKEKAHGKAEVSLYSMDDEETYGKEWFRLNFSEAIGEGLLSDYKVIVLIVDEQAAQSQKIIEASTELSISDTAKIIGCYKALLNQGLDPADNSAVQVLEKDDTKESKVNTGKKLRRAVMFANTIKNSKEFRDNFEKVVKALDKQEDDGFSCNVSHVDGSMRSSDREKELKWLRQAADDEDEVTCRILSNAKCLTEGVDVPTLDAILFMQARKSQVDVIQAVGRVMRRAKNKDYGYVILPVVILSGVDPVEALEHDKVYDVVWQVLCALRSHDDRLNAIINQLELGDSGRKKLPVEVVNIVGKNGSVTTGKEEELKDGIQTELDLKVWNNAIYAQIVEKVGDRQYFEKWANDVAKLHVRLVNIIDDLRNKHSDIEKTFIDFLEGLRKNINNSLTEEEATSMLAQQLLTRDVFDALFQNYEFAKHNPVAKSMNVVLNKMSNLGLAKELESLEQFYQSVKQRVSGIDNSAGIQRVLVELYEKFFSVAFPKVVEKLGIAYTPIELVDFILESTDFLVRKEFGRGLGDKDVKILDPFTGTGTFINRLFSNENLVPDEKLKHKYTKEVYANEILLMPYYIASTNIESAYHYRMKDKEYTPFPGIVLTDTFDLHERGRPRDDFFYENNKRAKAQVEGTIRIVLGNPPWSTGQRSQNDSNQNTVYERLRNSIKDTYAKRSSATLKNSLYDSYVQAFRLSSDLIKKQGGMVAMVTNGGWLESGSADGMRKCLVEEFDSIWVLNLRGNARLKGEAWRKEGGKIFGQSSRATVAITFLVKNPKKHRKEAEINYYDIGDYLSRKEKLELLKESISIGNPENKLIWEKIKPSPEGDWLNQRDPRFRTFIAIGNKATKQKKIMLNNNDLALFMSYCCGVKTNRDAWVYNFDRSIVSTRMQSMIEFYNNQVALFQKIRESEQKLELKPKEYIDTDETKISWDGTLISDLEKNRFSKFDESKIRHSMYRPFSKQWLYFDKQFNNSVYRIPTYFPDKEVENRVIFVAGVGSASFSVLMTDCIADFHLLDSQCFPRFVIENGNKCDNITEETLAKFREHYSDDSITFNSIFDYIYGILHAPDYCELFASNLKKELPRIPLSAHFYEFTEAGSKLAELHLHYETTQKYPLTFLVDGNTPVGGNLLLKPNEYKISKMKWATKTDHTTLIYNDHISLTGIPDKALRYIVNGKTALDWVIDRYQIKTHKTSGIVNDPNDWIAEQGKPDALISLIKQVTHVSVETVKIVESLPPSV